MSGGSGVTRAALVLTHRTIEAMRRSDVPYRVPDLSQTGLAVRVATNGAKTWDLSYRIKGATVKRVSLGKIGDVTLEQARNRARELTGAARGGRDLLTEEMEATRQAATRLTVEGLIESYVRRRVTGRLRTAPELESRLRRSLASVLSRYADDLRRRDLRPLFDQCADQGMEREAEKRRLTVGTMFRWALSQDIVDTDPTAGLAAYDPGTPRDRVLTAEEIATLWAWLDSGAMPAVPADILKLQLLTGARCGEISGMSAEEIDRKHWLWTLPAARSKNLRQRVTPIVGEARRLIEERLASVEVGFLFATEAGTAFKATNIGNKLATRTLPIAKFTTHDLRRTTATMMTEMAIGLELVAAVVGHEAGGKETRTLVRHYVRTDMLDRKRVALEAWDRRVMEIRQGATADKYPANLAQSSKASNVVPIKAMA